MNTIIFRTKTKFNKRIGAMSIFLFMLFLCMTVDVSYAQTQEDSLKLLQTEWHLIPCAKGLVAKQAQIKNIFGSIQSISFVEIKGKKVRKCHFCYARPGMKTSRMAYYFDADAAINGTFFDMRHFNSVCFIKKDGKVRDTTVTSQIFRGNGALQIRHDGLHIIPWNKETELSYISKHNEDIMVSGPLLLMDGDLWKDSEYGGSFGKTRHPRSAVGVKKDGTIILLTVDGRQKGNAQGMNLRELTYILKWMGCKEALNLDGGGSTTLYVKEKSAEGRVINFPCDNGKYDHKGERRVANMLLVGGNY